MLGFAHFMGGAIFQYMFKKSHQGLFPFVFMGFLGLLPDIDIIFNKLAVLPEFLQHRQFTHSLLFALAVGFVTLIVFRQNLPGTSLVFRKQYLPGVLAVLSHTLLDLIDRGTVAVWPGVKWDWEILSIPGGPNGGSSLEQVMLSTMIGSIIALGVLIYEYKGYRQRQDSIIGG